MVIEDVSATKVMVSDADIPFEFSAFNVTFTEFKKLSTLPELGVVKVMPPC